jgi:hypothetical protein
MQFYKVKYEQFLKRNDFDYEEQIDEEKLDNFGLEFKEEICNMFDKSFLVCFINI